MNSKSLISITQYFINLLGNRFYIYLFYNFIVAILDIIGITMFIPLIGYTLNISESIGGLEFMPKIFDSLGIPLNLYTALLILIIAFVLKGIMLYIRDQYFVKIRLSVMKKIRFDLVDKIENMSYQGFVQSDPGTIQFAMVGESARLIQTINFFIFFCQSLVLVITYLIIAFYSNWIFALLVIIGGLLTNFIYQYLDKLITSKGQQISKSGNIFNGFLIQALHNFKYLKVTNNYRLFNSRLKKSIEDFEVKQYEIGRINALTNGIKEPLIIMVIAIVIIIYIKGIGASTKGLLLSLLIFYRALSNLMSTQTLWTKFKGTYSSVPALEKLNLTLDNFKEEEQIQSSIRIETIDIHDANITYDGMTILDKISLSIKNKESIALVGESGAGKTTLANLISGLIYPDSGNILVNSNILEQNNLNSHRNRIGYVTQEPVIFDDSIYNNVTLWDEKSEENLAKFSSCLAMVNMVDFLTQLEHKEDTQLGNNGVLISGGQKQRISIARELYRDIDILIMDEATSSLDSETEKIIQSNIENLKGQYIMIIVAHRLSTIKSVDTIYLLDKGKIIDQGSFDELYKRSSKFKNMVDLQEI